MPTFLHTANGSKTVFKCLSSALAKSVRVDGIVVPPTATNATSITLATPPLAGVSVEVMYGEVRTVVNHSPGTPAELPGGNWPSVTTVGGMTVNGRYPVAAAINTAQSIAPPVVRYLDSTAENVVFTLDPNAAEVSVSGDGRIVSSRL